MQAWLPFSRNGRVAKFFSVSVLNGYLFSTMLFCRFQVDILVEIGKQCLPFISVLKINHLDCDYNSCPRIKWQPQKLSGPWDSWLKQCIMSVCSCTYVFKVYVLLPEWKKYCVRIGEKINSKSPRLIREPEVILKVGFSSKIVWLHRETNLLQIRD